MCLMYRMAKQWTAWSEQKRLTSIRTLHTYIDCLECTHCFHWIVSHAPFDWPLPEKWASPRELLMEEYHVGINKIRLYITLNDFRDTGEAEARARVWRWWDRSPNDTRSVRFAIKISANISHRQQPYWMWRSNWFFQRALFNLNCCQTISNRQKLFTILLN